MKVENGDEKIFLVKIENLTSNFLVQQNVDKSIPSCEDLIASKGHNHGMLLTFPMASNPFTAIQKKRFFHVILSHY